MLDSQGNPLKFGDEVLLHGQITGMSGRGDGSTVITVRGIDLGGKSRFAGIYAVESDIVRLFNSPAPAPATTHADASASPEPAKASPSPVDASPEPATGLASASSAAPTASPSVAEPAVK